MIFAAQDSRLRDQFEGQPVVEKIKLHASQCNKQKER